MTEEHTKFVAPLFTDKWELNAEIIIFTNILLSIYSPFKTMVTLEIKVENVVYNDQGPRYKKCPQCGLVWLRIYGCDNIVCGKRSISRDFNNKTWYNYTIQWVGKQLKIDKIASPTNQIQFSDTEMVGLTAEEKKTNGERAEQKKTLISPAGCGATMKFSAMIDVTTEIEAELKEFDFAHHGQVQNIFNKHAQDVSVLPPSLPPSVPPSLPHSPDDEKNWTRDNVKKWTTEDVKRCLEKMGLSDLGNTFVKQAIDGEVFLELKDNDLEKLGIVLGHRKKLCKQIQEILLRS